MHILNYTKQTQDFPDFWGPNGHIYLVKKDIFLNGNTFYPEGTIGYRMPDERSLDIDSEWDLYLADLILKDRKSS